jgi:hypothetical protein
MTRGIDRVTENGGTYVGFRMDEWRMGEQSPSIQSCVRKILHELRPEAHLRLKDPRLQVMVLPESEYSVWAYFPVHRGRWIARKVLPKPETRVLLVLSTAGFAEEPAKTLEDYLRDHFGHILLYLRSPKASSECADAQKEWRRLRLPRACGRCLPQPLPGLITVELDGPQRPN